MIRHDQRLGQAERPAQLPAHLERVEVVGVQVDRDQPDLAGPVQHPPDGRPRYRQPLRDLVLGQLVLVVEPGHSQQQFLVARPALADIWFGPHGMPPPSAGHEVIAPPKYPSRGTAKATARARWLLTVDDLPSVERDDRAVMNDAIGLSSSVIHSATSSGAPIRPSG